MVKQTTYRTVTAVTLAIIVVLILGVIVVNKGFGVDSSSSARSTVVQFGSVMQQVSLLSPDASSTIASIYGPYATPELIHTWQKDPEHAPGRLTSSPWPSGIEIKDVSKQGSGYIVSGDITFATSDGPAGSNPVILQIVPIDGKWLIGAYQEQISAATSTKQ